MKLSLIIPTYNRGNLIGETLQSVIDQSYSNWECLVVDDGSVDDTERVVSEFIDKDLRISYYKRPQDRPKGANACRNFGFEKSDGDIINWLDSDDLLVFNHFQIHVEEHLKTATDCVVTKASTFELNPEESNGFWSNVIPEQEPWKDMICGNISWATPSVTWKKKALSPKPFCEKLQSAQEWFFHTSMLIDKISYKIIEIGTIKVRRHEERIGKSISAQKFWSRFSSRFMIYKSLKKDKKLDKYLEFYLFRIMLNSLRKSAYHGYFKNVLKMSLPLFVYGIYSIYWRQLYSVILFGAPTYFITKKGETLFKLKKHF